MTQLFRPKRVFDRERKEVDVTKQPSCKLIGVSDGGVGVEGRKGQLYVPPAYQGRGFRDLLAVYLALTSLPPARNIDWKIDIKLKPMIEKLWARYNCDPPEVEYIDRSNDYPVMGQPKHADGKLRGIIAVSGGYDSMATLLSMRDCGIEVHAFSVNGINKSSYNASEIETVKYFCDKYDIPLISPKVVNSIECDSAENPIKNLMIYNMMMAEAERIGATVTGLGIFSDDTIANTYFPSDAWDLFQDYYLYMVDRYYQHGIFLARNKVESMYRLHADDLLHQVRSCLTPIRYFGQRQKSIAKKFPTIDLNKWKNCCFSCFKCAVAVMRAIDLQLVPDLREVPGLYKHCEAVLARTILSESKEGIEAVFYYRGPKWAEDFAKKNPDLF